MKLITKTTRELVDATDPDAVKNYSLPPGEHLVERKVLNLTLANGKHTVTYLVLAGTQIGAGEQSLLEWGPGYDDYEIVVIDDNGQIIPSKPAPTPPRDIAWKTVVDPSVEETDRKGRKKK